MKTSTRLVIGATVLLLGIGLISLGFIDQESDVRYVHDLTERPDQHRSGSFTLLGMPQPRELTGYGAEGEVVQANPAFSNATKHVVSWTHDGVLHFSTLRLYVDIPEPGISHWSLRNDTRVPSTGEAMPTAWTNWSLDRPHLVFQIQGFPDANGHQPVVWGVYEGVLRDPLQPKPSQFVGRLAQGLPDGTPLPAGALVYEVDEYTAGCSSKFLPPDVQEEYADDPDIT